MTSACRQAVADNTRAMLAFIARPIRGEPADPMAELLALAVLQRHDDIVDVCPAGVLLVAGGFTHPAHCEAVVRRAVVALGWGDAAATGVAICPTHADRVQVLVASAAASLRRALEVRAVADAVQAA